MWELLESIFPHVCVGVEWRRKAGVAGRSGRQSGKQVNELLSNLSVFVSHAQQHCFCSACEQWGHCLASK